MVPEFIKGWNSQEWEREIATGMKEDIFTVQHWSQNKRNGHKTFPILGSVGNAA